VVTSYRASESRCEIYSGLSTAWIDKHSAGNAIRQPPIVLPNDLLALLIFVDCFSVYRLVDSQGLGAETGTGSGNRDAISIDGNLLPRLLGKLTASRFHAFRTLCKRTQWVELDLSEFPCRLSGPTQSGTDANRRYNSLSTCMSH